MSQSRSLLSLGWRNATTRRSHDHPILGRLGLLFAAAALVTLAGCQSSEEVQAGGSPDVAAPGAADPAMVTGADDGAEAAPAAAVSDEPVQPGLPSPSEDGSAASDAQAPDAQAPDAQAPEGQPESGADGGGSTPPPAGTAPPAPVEGQAPANGGGGNLRVDGPSNDLTLADEGDVVITPEIGSLPPTNPPPTNPPPTSPPSTTTTTASPPPTGSPTTQPPPPPDQPDPDDPLWDIYTPRAGCSDGSVVPLGQAPGAKNFEPLGSIWCFDLAEPPNRTVAETSNSWVDDFTVNRLLLTLDDHEMDYRVFDNTGNAPGQSQHWINQNHWMVDQVGAFTGGSSIRPDRSFRFENGKFVVEGDFAAAIPEYGTNTWGEIVITSAPTPTSTTTPLYSYGQFEGHWAVGCRLHNHRKPICAVMGPNPDSPPSGGGCAANPGHYRVMELSWHLDCGREHFGGLPGVDNARWRECERDGFDMACRDRFRLEVTKDSLSLYVNGTLYFRDAGWPATHQLPDSFLNGEVYAYQSNWQWRAGDRAFRYHWDHFAVNPPNGPEPSEWWIRHNSPQATAPTPGTDRLGGLQS